MLDQNIHEKLDRIGTRIVGTSELAELLGKAEFTVCEWRRLWRVWVEKRISGRGTAGE